MQQNIPHSTLTTDSFYGSQQAVYCKHKQFVTMHALKNEAPLHKIVWNCLQSAWKTNTKHTQG